MYDTSRQPQKMQERYKDLPEEITDLFEYDTVTHVIERIIKEYGLKEEDRPLLQMEIEMVLYFFLPRVGLAERLQESLNIDKARAEGIAKKINDDLFILVDGLMTFVEKQLVTNERTPGEAPLITIPTTPPVDAVAKSQPVDTSTGDRSQLKPLRTFAMDVDVSRAHGYGAFRSEEEDDGDEPTHRSSQDDIIKK